MTAEFRAHVDGCAQCARIQAEMQKTMSVMDEWNAPSPSPFFNARLHARLAEVRTEEAAPWSITRWGRNVLGVSGWRPALAATLTVAAAVAVWYPQPVPVETNPSVVIAGKGTAVSDLQSLEKLEMYSHLDLLDDLAEESAPEAGSSEKKKTAETGTEI